MSSSDKSRIPGLDIVRTLAVACVLLVHSISYLGVMDGPTDTIAWSVFLVLRFAAMSGVPLFLILSGYLCKGKTLSRKYYAGIIPILVSYLIISAGSVVMTEITAPGTFSPVSAVFGILNFTAHGYAWYVEMYIGLFLLIPFLNIVWNALETRNKRLVLIITLLVMTVLPPTLQSFHPFGVKLDILPDYWAAIYPLTYYFIGAYLHDYPPQLKLSSKIIFAAASTALPCVLCFVKTRVDGSYAWYIMNGFASATAVLTGVSYFLLFRDIKSKSAFVEKTFTLISLCSFEMYLFSYLTDHAMLKVIEILKLGRLSLKWPTLFFGSFVLSFAISFVLRLILRPITSRLVKAASGK